MKNFGELLEDLKNDAALAGRFTEAVSKKLEAGAQNDLEAVIPTAAEFGYEVKKEELEQYYDSLSDDLSEKELGKIAGGTIVSLDLPHTSVTAGPLTTVNRTFT